MLQICKEDDIEPPVASDLPVGGIVGSVLLEDIVESYDSPWWDGESLAWVFGGYTPLTFIPCKGKLGLWDFPKPDELILE
jgi:hypothetical protein